MHWTKLRSSTPKTQELASMQCNIECSKGENAFGIPRAHTHTHTFLPFELELQFSCRCNTFDVCVFCENTDTFKSKICEIFQRWAQYNWINGMHEADYLDPKFSGFKLLGANPVVTRPFQYVFPNLLSACVFVCALDCRDEKWAKFRTH